MTELQWGAPPFSRSDRTVVGDFITALQARPGEWAKYPSVLTKNSASTTVTVLRKKGLEATARGTDVYARFVGEA